MSEISETRKSELRQSEDYKKTKEILGKLYDNVTNLQSEMGFLSARYKIFWKNSNELEDKWDDAEEVSIILRRLKGEVQYPNERLKSMSKMLAYLGLVESLGTTLMDVALLLFIANGTEVHTRGLVRHVTKLEELKDVDTGYKLKMLHDEGLDIFQKLFNQDIRNVIAHLKFKIDDDGNIRQTDNSPIHIDEKISDFWYAVDVFNLVLQDIGFLRFTRLSEGVS